MTRLQQSGQIAILAFVSELVATSGARKSGKVLFESPLG